MSDAPMILTSFILLNSFIKYLPCTPVPIKPRLILSLGETNPLPKTCLGIITIPPKILKDSFINFLLPLLYLLFINQV